VIAYSTMSQLGYMVMACGLGAYVAGMFHLLTHGVFKALLFLAAGSVIHALSDEQDIRKMGQVKKYMPTTYWTMLWGSLALSGIFPFAGFFSKDEILGQAFAAGTLGKFLWLVGVIVAFMTAFYTFRVFFLVFHGEDNVEEEAKHHAHESPAVITIPLVTLAVGSLLVGWLGNPLFGTNYVHEFLSPVFHSATSHVPAASHAAAGLVTDAFAAGGMEAAGEMAGEAGGHSKVVEVLLMIFSLAVAGAGIWLAYQWYYRASPVPARVAQSYKGLYQGSLNKWYWDELYDAVFTKPTLRIADRLWRIADEIVIDKVLVDGVGVTTKIGGEILKFFQTGRVQHYAMVMSLGIFFIVGGYFLF
jgi:NADH-quinone oxidoreductase subunit L